MFVKDEAPLFQERFRVASSGLFNVIDIDVAAAAAGPSDSSTTIARSISGSPLSEELSGRHRT